MKETVIDVRNRMRERSLDYLVYSEGQPILNDVPFHPPKSATNSLNVWNSLEYFEFRRITRIVWSRLYRRLADWIDGAMDNLAHTSDHYDLYLDTFSFFGLLLPLLAFSLVSLASLRREYHVSLLVFQTVNSKVIASSPQLMFKFKKFFRYHSR